MGKPNSDDSQIYDRTSTPSPIPPPPIDFDMNWQTALSQSEPSIQSRRNQLLNRLAASTYNSSSYKVSIGHETVNITEIARQRDSPENPAPLLNTPDKRQLASSRKGANILSLCFMCLVSASLILIAISTMHLILQSNRQDVLPSTNLSVGFGGQLDTVANLVVPTYDRSLRELATVLCLLMIVLNCFCVLIFSIEIYLGCNLIKSRDKFYRCLFSSSTSRFIAICSFYASIPSFILVMCLFIILNMSLIPAIISLLILGVGLIFILMTLLSYFSLWQTHHVGGINSTIYHTIDATHLCDDEIDLSKTDELSTLV